MIWNLVSNYMSHTIGLDPDLTNEEMAKSESKSKFGWASATRVTFLLNLEDLDEPKPKRKRRNSI